MCFTQNFGQKFYAKNYIGQFSGNSSSGHRLCPEGFVCPEGTGRDLVACLPGTYSPVMGLSNTSECLQCDGQHHSV